MYKIIIFLLLLSLPLNSLAASVDTDGDGISDDSDNCPTISNSAQIDTNTNDLGDLCESVETLTGDFYGVEFLDDSIASGGNSLTVRTEQLFDGSNVGTGQNLAASFSPLEPPFQYPYSILEDNTFIHGIVGDIGAVSYNQNYIVLGDTDPVAEDDLMMKVFARKGSVMDVASLVGDYFVARIMDVNVSGVQEVSISRVDFSFDGNGNVSYNTIERSRPWPDPPLDSGADTYSVADDGLLTFGTLGSGFISVDKNVIGIVDTDAGGDNSIHMMIGVKKGSGMTTADLYGDFVVPQIGNGYYSESTFTDRTKVNFDGQGGFIYEDVGDSTGPPNGSGTGTYSVATDGTFTLDGVVSGAIAPDGQSIVLFNADVVADSGTGINFGVKISPSNQENAQLDAPELTYQANGKNVSVIWTAIPGAVGYLLSYVPYPYNGHDVIQNVDVGNTTSFEATLWDGAAYMISVKAYNNHGEGDKSNAEHFIIQITPPETPKMTYSFDNNVLTINWTSVEGADGYLLSYSPSPYEGEETITTIDMGEATNARYTLPSNSAYFIAIQAYNDGGVSPYSMIKEVVAP